MEDERDTAPDRAGPQQPAGRSFQWIRAQSGAGTPSLIIDASLILLFLLAFVLVINPWPRWVAPPVMSANLTLAQVMAFRGGSLLIGGLLLFTVVLLSAARVRARVARIERLQGGVCPVCGSDDLRRIHRRWYHHLPGALGIPVRRYVCGNCQWRGARIDRQRL